MSPPKPPDPPEAAPDEPPIMPENLDWMRSFMTNPAAWFKTSMDRLIRAHRKAERGRVQDRSALRSLFVIGHGNKNPVDASDHMVALTLLAFAICGRAVGGVVGEELLSLRYGHANLESHTQPNRSAIHTLILIIPLAP